MLAIDDKVRSRIRRIIQEETDRCAGSSGSQLSRERADLKRRYLGYGYNIDAERKDRGLSTYVDRTVLETVEWAKPALMRVFTAGDEIVRFDPKNPDEEEAANDATVYVNQVVFGRNMFKLIHDVLTDGLYQRVGWCLAHCPKETKQRVYQYSGLFREEALALLSDPMGRLGAFGPDDVDVQSYMTPDGMQYDVTIRAKIATHDLKLEPVPSEQVIVSSDASDVEHARFVAHWEIRTASDLRREGYSQELIDALPPYDDADEMEETTVSRNVNSDSSQHDYSSAAAPENRRFKIYEAWTDVDINGDGIAEKVKVTYCTQGGDTSARILDVEEWPLYRPPLFAASSVPLPHSAIGLCLADLVKDVQDLRSDLFRQLLDALAFSNQAEIVVNEGQNGDVEYDSLLNRGPGAVHRIKGDATIEPLKVVTSAADASQSLQLTDDLIERRTGISSRTQSIQADSLQNTATGAAIQEEAINQRLELIARVYAETFFKPLGRYVLHLLHRYQDKAVQLRIKGRYMEFDPRKWDPDMTISVAVGLGTGNRSRLVGTYQQILQIQSQFIQMLQKNSPVRLKNIIYTCDKLAEAAGLEAPERFFGTEEDAEKAEQAILQAGDAPSKDEQKAQADMQKAMVRAQIDREKAQSDVQVKAFEAQSRAKLEQDKLRANTQLRLNQQNAERALDQTKLLMGGTAPGLTQIRGRTF